MFITHSIRTSILTVFTSVFMFNSVAFAAAPSISIPVSTIVRGPVGSNHVLATTNVDQDLKGLTCNVQATAKNQGSVHPGNNITVASGSTSVVLQDVERAAGVNTTANGTLTLGDSVTATLTLGQNRVFSGGMSVDITCETPKQIDVCRDGKIITIDENDRKDSDTNPPCPVETVQVCRDNTIVTIPKNEVTETDTTNLETCEMVEVCRDGKVITIDKNDRKDSDTNPPCPQVLGEETPKELPRTGLGSIVSGFVGTGALAMSIRNWLESRKMLKRGAFVR